MSDTSSSVDLTIDEHALTQVFAWKGWAVLDSGPYGLCACPDARIPSPYASTDDHEDEPKYPGVKKATQVLNDALSDSDEIKFELEHCDMLNDGSILRLGVYDWEAGQADTQRLLFDRNETHWEFPLYAGREPTDLMKLADNDRDNFLNPQFLEDPDYIDPNANKTLHIRRLIDRRSAGEEEVGYFILALELEGLVINHKTIRPYALVGPLPDFTVIEIGSFSMFWWRTREALDYIPEVPAPRGQKRSHDEGPGSRGADDPGLEAADSAPEAPESQDGQDAGAEISGSQAAGPDAAENANTAAETILATTWQEILDDRLAQNRECRRYRESREQVFPCLELRTLDDLTQDQCMVAIASVWMALRTGQEFAIADRGFFDAAVPTSRVLATPKPLIMPALLERKSPSGKTKTHLFLGVATFIGPKSHGVSLDIFNSSWENVNRQQAEQECKRLITGSEWPFDQSGISNPYIMWGRSRFHNTPQQYRGARNSGLYAIFNAWAVMLGIPIEPNDKRREKRGEALVFPRQALEIINLAMGGCMDSRTIQAFMNVWGYSAEQECNDREQLVAQLSTERMSSERLHGLFWRLGDEEGSADDDSPDDQPDDDTPDRDSPDDDPPGDNSPSNGSDPSDKPSSNKAPSKETPSKEAKDHPFTTPHEPTTSPPYTPTEPSPQKTSPNPHPHQHPHPATPSSSPPSSSAEQSQTQRLDRAIRQLQRTAALPGLTRPEASFALELHVDDVDSARAWLVHEREGPRSSSSPSSRAILSRRRRSGVPAASEEESLAAAAAAVEGRRKRRKGG